MTDYKPMLMKGVNVAAIAGGAVVGVGALMEGYKHLKAKNWKGTLGSAVVLLVGVYAVNAGIEKLG